MPRWADPQVLAVAVAVVLALAYLAWSPLSPDVAAQSGRAAAARLTHLGTWWSGWFGGLPLMSYSLVVPPIVAVLGVPSPARWPWWAPRWPAHRSSRARSVRAPAPSPWPSRVPRTCSAAGRRSRSGWRWRSPPR